MLLWGGGGRRVWCWSRADAAIPRFGVSGECNGAGGQSAVSRSHGERIENGSPPFFPVRSAKVAREGVRRFGCWGPDLGTERRPGSPHAGEGFNAWTGPWTEGGVWTVDGGLWTVDIAAPIFSVGPHPGSSAAAAADVTQDTSIGPSQGPGHSIFPGLVHVFQPNCTFYLDFSAQQPFLPSLRRPAIMASSHFSTHACTSQTLGLQPMMAHVCPQHPIRPHILLQFFPIFQSVPVACFPARLVLSGPLARLSSYDDPIQFRGGTEAATPPMPGLGL